MVIEISAVSEISKVSQFDGISPPVDECLVCNLTYHKEIKTERKLCKSCFKLLYVNRIAEGLGRYSLPALITGIAIWFWFREFLFMLFPLSLFIIVPVTLTGFFLPMIMYYGMEEDHTLTHKMRMREKLGDNKYLEMVENYLTNNRANTVIENLVLREFTSQVLLSHKPNPPRILERWAAFFDLSTTEFVERLIEETELMEGFTPFSGVGVLPDIWYHVEDDEIRGEIMDKLAHGCSLIEEAASSERKYFLEDLYLLEEELFDLAETNPKWRIIIDTLDAFEPDEVPKSTLQSLMAQANENAMMMEQQKMAKGKKTGIDAQSREIDN